MNERTSFYDHIAQTSDAPMGLEISHAEGPWIYTQSGEAYLDLISGIAVSSLGHRHPAVVKAIKEQLDRHLHVMVYGEFIQKPQSQLAELLTNQLPAALDRIYFTNSGTEANEGALKLAKKYTGRHALVSCHNSYHGDTHGSLSVTGRAIYQDPYKPLLPDVSFMRYNHMDDLEMITEEVAAVIVEPIQGEGGIIPADSFWLNHLRERTLETGTLLIFDEIQSGFGRTGKLFAFEHFGVIPDILCLAKAMGGGLPIGGFVSSSEIFEVFKSDPPLNHVTTFGGHPVSCAAAHANLKELLSGDYMMRARLFHDIAQEELRGPGIIEVRGVGAMLGLELESFELTEQVVTRAMKEGVILGWTLHSNTLVRIAPPLIMEPDLFREKMVMIRELAADVKKEASGGIT